MPMLMFLIGWAGGFDDAVAVADFRSTVLLMADTSLTMILGSGLERLPVNVIDSGTCGVGPLVIDILFVPSPDVRLIDKLVRDSGGVLRVDDGILTLTDGLVRAAIEGLPLVFAKGLALAFDSGLARALDNGLVLAASDRLPFDDEPLECVDDFW